MGRHWGGGRRTARALENIKRKSVAFCLMELNLWSVLESQYAEWYRRERTDRNRMASPEF